MTASKSGIAGPFCVHSLNAFGIKWFNFVGSKGKSGPGTCKRHLHTKLRPEDIIYSAGMKTHQQCKTDSLPGILKYSLPNSAFSTVVT